MTSATASGPTIHAPSTMPSAAVIPSAPALIQNWSDYRQAAEQATITGQLERAEQICHEAMKRSESRCQIAYCLNNLAGVYYGRGELLRARQICLKVLAIYQSIYPASLKDIGITFNNLGMVYHAMKEYQMAEKYYRLAFQARSQEQRKDHPDMICLLENYKTCMRINSRANYVQDRWDKTSQFEALPK